MKIKQILAREIYNSQGWPTVQCELFLEDGTSVLSSVPSGRSLGEHEAVEFLDGGARLTGRGVLKAVETIEHKIAPLLVGQEPRALEMDLKLIELDGTADKSRLGSNALLAVSMALYRAEALSEGIELYELIAELLGFESVTMPFPFLNVINGGAHVDNNLRFQEYMVVPIGAPTFRSSFEVGVLVFHKLGELLKKAGKSTAIGPEGGYACWFKSEWEALDMLFTAIESINRQHELSCVIALDCAASQFYDPTTQLYQWHEKKYSTDEMIAFYEALVTQYPVYSIEDGLSQNDWQGWTTLTKLLGNKVQIVADDLTTTNLQRINFASEHQAATSVIIKPNQVGTITEALQAIYFCKNNGLQTIVSHRFAETEDTFIADLAVGASAGQIKAGSCSRSDRVAKYNRLLAVEDKLMLSLLNKE